MDHCDRVSIGMVQNQQDRAHQKKIDRQQSDSNNHNQQRQPEALAYTFIIQNPNVLTNNNQHRQNWHSEAFLQQMDAPKRH